MRVAERVSRTDEGLEVLRRCFSGERFSFKGKRYELNAVMITPGYVQAVGDVILGGFPPENVVLMDIDPPVAAVECGLLVVGEAEGKDGQGQGQLFTQEQIWQSLGVIVLAFFKN